MKNTYVNERDINLKSISDRHILREIEGFTSWRHFVVHQDRAWLLNAFEKIQGQVEKVHQASANPGDKDAVDAEVQALLDMFVDDVLNHLGDADEDE